MEPLRTARLSRVLWDLDVEQAKDEMTEALFHDLTANLDRYREDPQDDEAVHDIRVDIRKLISLLYFFKPLIDEEKERSLRQGLKEVLKSFGAIREGDMLVKSLRVFLEEEAEHLQPAEAVIGRVREDRERDVTQSLERMGSDALKDKVGALKEALLGRDLLKGTPGDSGESEAGALKMEAFSRERFKQMLGKLRKLARKDGFSDISDVHAYRIRCKKASYSLMLTGTVTSLDGEDWVRRLKEIQDVTGNIHDAQVNMALLEAMPDVEKRFEDAYRAFLDRIIRKKMQAFEEQLEEVRGSSTRLEQKG